MGTAGWAALPRGTNVEFINAPGTEGVGPAERLVELSDRICDIFVLGQTLSTDVGDSGSRALGEVHAGVRQDVLKGVADFAVTSLQQLVREIVLLNYGEDSELPELVPDIVGVEDQVKKAERDVTLFGQLGLPVSKEFLYNRHGVPMPQSGDELFKAKSGQTPSLTKEKEPLNVSRAS